MEPAGCFTAPAFATFTALVAGLVTNTARGTVTGMLTAAGLARTWPHDRAHAFFSRASWNTEILGMRLSHLIVGTPRSDACGTGPSTPNPFA